MFRRQLHGFVFNCLFNDALEDICLTSLIASLNSIIDLSTVRQILLSSYSTVWSMGILLVIAGDWSYRSKLIIFWKSVRLTEHLLCLGWIRIRCCLSFPSQLTALSLRETASCVMVLQACVSTGVWQDFSIWLISSTHRHRWKSDSLCTRDCLILRHFRCWIRIYRSLRKIISIINNPLSPTSSRHNTLLLSLLDISWIALIFHLLERVPDFFLNRVTIFELDIVVWIYLFPFLNWRFMGK